MEDKNWCFVTDDCKSLIDSYKGENKKIRTEKILRKEKTNAVYKHIYGLKWVNLTQMTIISTTVGRNPLEEME